MRGGREYIAETIDFRSVRFDVLFLRYCSESKEYV
jgi:hypothetical protein